MAKGIIVLDIPLDCRCCPFIEVSEENHMWCLVSNLDDCSRIHKMIPDEYSKPDWCPIKEMPERKALTGDASNTTKMGEELVKVGFNACLDEIEGKM